MEAASALPGIPVMPMVRCFANLGRRTPSQWQSRYMDAGCSHGRNGRPNWPMKSSGPRLVAIPTLAKTITGIGWRRWKDWSLQRAWQARTLCGTIKTRGTTPLIAATRLADRIEARGFQVIMIDRRNFLRFRTRERRLAGKDSAGTSAIAGQGSHPYRVSRHQGRPSRRDGTFQSSQFDRDQWDTHRAGLRNGRQSSIGGGSGLIDLA